MRYLIISDIHANLEALEAVLEHAQQQQYSRIVCCGDLIGYGADPNAVVDWVRANAHVVIRGNHDKVCTGVEEMEDYNPAAVLSTMWTRRALTPENREYVHGLPKGPATVEEGGFQIVHGSPVDEDEYLITTSDAMAARSAVQLPLTFFGHTHLQGGFFFRRNFVRGIDKVPQNRTEATVVIDDSSRFLINPGSVGQPRDRDHRAAYVIYSAEEKLVTFYRVEYDIPKAQMKILAAQLPEPLAARLSIGS